jgi:hypothetical protein
MSQGGLQGRNGGENVSIANKTQVTNPKNLPFEVILAASEGNVKPLFHDGTHLFRLHLIRHDSGDGGAGAVITAK